MIATNIVFQNNVGIQLLQELRNNTSEEGYNQPTIITNKAGEFKDNGPKNDARHQPSLSFHGPWHHKLCGVVHT
jgi:hypothetical protein